jgi:hypothetical protein
VGLKARRTLKSSASGGAGKKSNDAEAAERAIAALKRTCAPFTANESLIGSADDTTLPLEGEEDVEITMEEWPVAGQRFGHRGWVAGGGQIEEEEVNGEQAGGEGADLLPAGDGQKKAGNNVSVRNKNKLDAGKGRSAKPGGNRAREKERSRAEVKWSSDDDDDGAGDSDPPGGGSMIVTAHKSADGTKGGKAKQYQEEPDQSDGGGADGKEGARNKAGGEDAIRKSEEVSRKVQVKPKTFLDDRNAKGGDAARADLKGEKRTAAKDQRALARKRTGAAKKLQQDFDDAVDELRNAKPLLLGVSERGENKMVIWGRTAALTAMREVGLTSETWGDYGEEDQDSLLEAALEWLEEHKPKNKHTFGAGGEAGGASEIAGGAEGAAGAEMRSPALKQAEVEGDADVADSGGDGRQSDVGGEEALSDRGPESGASDKEPGAKGEEVAGEEKAGEGSTRNPIKRPRNSVEEGLGEQRTNRRERRSEEQHRCRQERQKEHARARGEQGRTTPPPKSVGRSKAAELEEHRRSTRKREKARREAMELVGEALKQQRRGKAGAVLTADEKELAKFAKTLSPVKLLGAGFRLQTDKDDDTAPIVRSDDEDALEELMEETGCGREDAREALDRSCDWTASGRPSRVKAARWLLEQEEEREHQGGNEQEHEEDNDCEVVGFVSPGGTYRANAVSAVIKGNRSGAGKAANVREHTGEGGEASSSHQGLNAKNSKADAKISRKSVSSKEVERGGKGDSPEVDGNGDSVGSESDSSSSSWDSLVSSSQSESGGSDSSDSRNCNYAGQKRMAAGDHSSSLSRSQVGKRSREQQEQHSARYVRQLMKALKIDAAWAKDVYDACIARGTTSYDGLLRYFYRQEAAYAKGTQKDTARALHGGGQQQSKGRESGINLTLPTFVLPEWTQGQPPNGGVHYATLQKMLGAYERYDKQTNYATQVTFKSMIGDRLKPNFESKCGLPPTVWLPPVEDDWKEVAAGRAERGGWSDLRFLRRVRKILQPTGRTNYEIAFESMVLKHRGTDEQLVVALDLWGTNWLAKEREAEEQGKELPSQKMKAYFKKAVAGVARFRRWLEGRTFTSSKDWYGILCRKLHRSLGKTAEAAHDRELEGGDRGRDGDRGNGGSGWRGGRGGSSPTTFGERGGRGGGGYRGGRGGSAPASGSTTRDSWLGNSQKFSDSGADARANAHTAGVGIPRHSGGVEPMESSNPRSPERQRGASRGRGSFQTSPFRGSRGGDSDRSGRQGPVNPMSEESKEKLPKGARWHDSAMSTCACRDPDCGTRQDVPFCQGCGMHGHDRPYCFKAGEPRFNPTGYWCVNKPREHPIEGLGRRQQSSSSVATGRSNMLDASQQ